MNSRFADGERVRFVTSSYARTRPTVGGIGIGEEGNVRDHAGLLTGACGVRFDADPFRTVPMWDEELVSLCPRRT
jgi:hypothetical protein